LSEIGFPPDASTEFNEFYNFLDKEYLDIKESLKDADLNPQDFIRRESNRQNDIELPLFKIDSIHFFEDYIQNLFISLSEEFMANNKGNIELKDFFKKMKSDPSKIQKILKDYMNGKIDKDIDISAEFLNSISIYLLRPFFSWISSNINNFDSMTDKWFKNYCPFCGSKADLGYLSNEEGQKYLWCSLCGTDWRYHRFACPHCENVAADGSNYFIIKGSPYKVDLCNNCNDYFKVVDERKLPEEKRFLNSWSINDLICLHLDEIARQEGHN